MRRYRVLLTRDNKTWRSHVITVDGLKKATDWGCKEVQRLKDTRDENWFVTSVTPLEKRGPR